MAILRAKSRVLPLKSKELMEDDYQAVIDVFDEIANYMKEGIKYSAAKPVYAPRVDTKIEHIAYTDALRNTNNYATAHRIEIIKNNYEEFAINAYARALVLADILGINEEFKYILPEKKEKKPVRKSVSFNDSVAIFGESNTLELKKHEGTHQYHILFEKYIATVIYSNNKLSLREIAFDTENNEAALRKIILLVKELISRIDITRKKIKFILRITSKIDMARLNTLSKPTDDYMLPLKLDDFDMCDKLIADSRDGKFVHNYNPPALSTGGGRQFRILPTVKNREKISDLLGKLELMLNLFIVESG